MPDDVLAGLLDLLQDIRAAHMTADEWQMVTKTLATLASAVRTNDLDELGRQRDQLDGWLPTRVKLVGGKKDEPPEDRIRDRIDNLVQQIKDVREKDRSRR
jgi:CATRA-associated small protein